MPKRNNDSATRVVEQFQARQAMSRGYLVVDENIQNLANVLRQTHIRVIVPRSGTPDDQIKTDLLPNRILVTKNSKDFKNQASSFEYGIISLDKLKFIDPEPNPAKNRTVRLISDAIINYKLWSKGHGFILTLKENGKHQYEDLID